MQRRKERFYSDGRSAFYGSEGVPYFRGALVLEGDFCGSVRGLVRDIELGE